MKQIRKLEELVLCLHLKSEFTPAEAFGEVDTIPVLHFVYAADALPDQSNANPLTGLQTVILELPVKEHLPETLQATWCCDTPAQNCFYLKAESSDDADLNRAIAAVFNHYLVFFRPLAHYRCSFFLPLFDLEEALGLPCVDEYRYPVADDSDASSVSARESAEAQAFFYFQPALRDLLFNLDGVDNADGLQPLREWRIPEAVLQGWQLSLDHVDGFSIDEADFTDVILFRYFNGMHVLAFSLEPAALRHLGLKDVGLDDLYQGQAPRLSGLLSDGDDWWHALLLSDWMRDWRDIQALQMDYWLRFTRFVRLLYPSFREQFTEQKIARVHLKREGFSDERMFDDSFDMANRPMAIPPITGCHISPLIRSLLAAFYSQPDTDSARPKVDEFFDHYQHVFDDRLFVNVAYGLVGGVLPDDKREQVFALALYVDRAEDAFLDGYAYSPDYIRPRLQEDSLRIWERAGTSLGYTDFSNASLGFGGYFNTIVAPVHVRFIYERMLVLALLYRASLNFYSHRITQTTEDLVCDHIDTSDVKGLRSEFIRFTNQYWFHDITNQMQGKLVFSKQQDALELERQYDFIKDELERTDEFLETRRDVALQKQSWRWTVFASTVAIFALWFSLLPYLADDKGKSSWDEAIKGYFINAPCNLSENVVDLLWIFMPPGFFALLIGLFLVWWRRNS